MKKIISILLSLALLLSCTAVLAEAAEKTNLGTVDINGEFTLNAAIPEGYTMQTLRSDNTCILEVFTSEDPTKPILTLSVGLEDSWPEGSKLNNITDEELKEIEKSFYYEDEPVELSYMETEHGTKLIAAKYPESNLIIFYTLYDGYEIEFTLFGANETQLTQEQIDTCVKFLSDLDFIPVEKKTENTPAEKPAETTEAAALPAYTWNGDDPVWGAVVKYMQENDFGFAAPEAGILVPTPIILKTVLVIDKFGETVEATVYGNFWIYTYALDGKTLVAASCGENPGKLTMAKKDGEWTVTGAEFAEDGENFAESIKKLADGDEQLEKDFFESSDSMLAQYQRAVLVNYVEDNKLDITAYQDYGQDPVSLTD